MFILFRVNIQMLIVSSRENSSFITRKNFYLLRRQVTEVLFQLRQLLYSGKIRSNSVDLLIRPLYNYLEFLSALPIIDVIHTVHSSIGNEVRYSSANMVLKTILDSLGKIYTFFLFNLTFVVYISRLPSTTRPYGMALVIFNNNFKNSAGKE